MLIDSNVTHSFISYGMVKRLKLESILVNHICIEMPDKDNVMSNQILLGETIALRG